MAESLKTVQLFTDGACLGNPGPGGWGAILRYNQHERELSGSDPETTNNRMELTAVIEGLRSLKEGVAVTIITDSNYVRQGMTEWLPKWQQNGWRTAAKKPVKNKDLWQALIAEIERHQVQWQWVKGHAGHPENERADELASQAAKGLA